MSFSPLRAKVRAGRLTLDEPTSLPEGAEIDLVPTDGDELDADERARRHEFLAASIAAHVPGSGAPASDVLAEIRARR